MRLEPTTSGTTIRRSGVRIPESPPSVLGTDGLMFGRGSPALKCGSEKLSRRAVFGAMSLDFLTPPYPLRGSHRGGRDAFDAFFYITPI